MLKVTSQRKYCFHTTAEAYWSVMMLLPTTHKFLYGFASSGTCNGLCFVRSQQINTWRNIPPRSQVRRERNCICTSHHLLASHWFSFYLQTDTGVWRKHVDVVFTQRINNNCFAPVDKMCSKLENLHWENREKLGEQKQNSNSQQEFHTMAEKPSLSWNERKIVHPFTLPSQ